MGFSVATPNSKPSSIAISRKHTKAEFDGGTNWSKSQIKTTNTSRRCPIPHSSKKSGAYTARGFKVIFRRICSSGDSRTDRIPDASPESLGLPDLPNTDEVLAFTAIDRFIEFSRKRARTIRSQPPSITTC